MSGVKERILSNLKNLIGWRTRRKIVVFSVDDYGNVRLHSKAAREAMNNAGLKVASRFDAYDTLETSQDLEALYGALRSVKDKNNRHAVFTPFALPCNIDFEAMAAEGYQAYRYERLTQTHEKLAAIDPQSYGSVGAMLKQGIAEGIFMPQFHGREHLNVKVFEEKLRNRDEDILISLRNRSYTSISYRNKVVSPTAAFAFWDQKETEAFPQILQTGLDAFEEVYGYRARVFTPPTQQFPDQFEPLLHQGGIRVFDRPFYAEKHVGNGKYARAFAVSGYKKKLDMVILVRNVVFEPTNDRGGIDWIAYVMKQIEAAFRWNRPAIISSHRVNFCGYTDPKNREKGINALRSLLKAVTTRYPDVEFMSADELGKIIASNPER